MNSFLFVIIMVILNVTKSIAGPPKLLCLSGVFSVLLNWNNLAKLSPLCNTPACGHVVSYLYLCATQSLLPNHVNFVSVTLLLHVIK